MSVRSHSRGSPAASSIRLALRTSSIVATRSASFVRWVLRWFGSRRLSSVLRLSAISVMPFMMRFQGPPRAEALNHTPIHQVNNLLAELIDGKIASHVPSALDCQSSVYRIVARRFIVSNREYEPLQFSAHREITGHVLLSNPR